MSVVFKANNGFGFVILKKIFLKSIKILSSGSNVSARLCRSLSIHAHVAHTDLKRIKLNDHPEIN